jgi:hypothetical protein
MDSMPDVAIAGGAFVVIGIATSGEAVYGQSMRSLTPADYRH